MQTIDRTLRGRWTSASNAAADLGCPARHLAQRGLEERDSKDAATGRAVHNVLALIDTPEHKAAYEALKPDQRDIHDRCLAIAERKKVEFFGREAANPSLRTFREQRYWVKLRKPAPAEEKTAEFLEHSGQPDLVYRLGMRALVVEFKTLFGDIPGASSNMQLRDQACLVRGNLLVNEVGAVLVQPWVNANPEVCLYTAGDLDRASKEMFARVIASNDPASRRIAGEVQCGFCLAKTQCDAYQKWAGGSVPAMLTVLDVPMEAWTPEQRAIAADRLSVAQDYLDQLKDFLKSGLEKDPEFVPGWGLQPGTERETITDPQGVFERWVKLVPKLPPEDQVKAFMRTVTVRKAPLREILAAYTDYKKGKALQDAVAGLLDGLVETKFSAPSLKRLKP